MAIKLTEKRPEYGTSYAGNLNIDKSIRLRKEGNHIQAFCTSALGKLENAPWIGPALSRIEEQVSP